MNVSVKDSAILFRSFSSKLYSDYSLGFTFFVLVLLWVKVRIELIDISEDYDLAASWQCLFTS